MKLTAKFAGVCRTCHTIIMVGEQIEWSKSEGSVHAACPGNAEKAPTLGYTCRSCANTGLGGDYPFSTAPGTGYCDDCC